MPRYSKEAHYENHPRAAELQDLAAHTHRAAEEHRGKQDHETGEEQSRQELEHSQQSYLHHDHSEPTNQHGIKLFGHEDIARVAYELWVERGCPEGSPDEDWFHAV
ncbi:MAG TPA: DUF2934 domain-containing protein, partial [Bryobacteraceae bacterium]